MYGFEALDEPLHIPLAELGDAINQKDILILIPLIVDVHLGQNLGGLYFANPPNPVVFEHPPIDQVLHLPL